MRGIFEMPPLFTPFRIKDVGLRNRIAVPPMCQYRAEEGLINDWHRIHYAAIARGGAGLVIVEATAVSPEGRITPGCTGIWTDDQAQGLADIVRSIKQAGATPGIQIAHAGRKASANRPWEGDNHIAPDDPRGWDVIAPSSVAFSSTLNKVPRAMTVDDIKRVQQDFVDAAERALEAGFEWLELHFAHGYLAQSFFSVHSNFRQDEYGGDFAKRTRFLKETFTAVRSVWPERFPLTVRLGVIEYDGRDEETVSESIELVKALKADGLDLLSVTLGFSTTTTQIPWGPALLAPVTSKIRAEAALPVAAAWGIDEPATASKLIEGGTLDLVMVGRAHLSNPHYPYAAAITLGIKNPAWVLPAPYAHWLARYR